MGQPADQVGEVMSGMTDDELLTLCEKAEAGPWIVKDGGVGPIVAGPVKDNGKRNKVAVFPMEGDHQNDADFIAAAREAVPRLLAENCTLHRWLEAVGNALQEAGFTPLGDDYAAGVVAMGKQLEAAEKGSDELCTNYLEVSMVQGPHCYNCVRRDGYPWMARPTAVCQNFLPVVALSKGG